MTFLPISSSHFLRNTALGLLIAAGSTLASVETASAVQQRVSLESLNCLGANFAGGGDREFSGNGPMVQVSTKLNISGDQSALMAHVNFRLKETKHNWTEGSYYGDHRVYTAPYGMRIVGILSESFSQASYLDRDHQIDYITPKAGPVAQFQVVGDSKGRDLGFGGCQGSYLNVRFKDVVIELQPAY